jgi:phage FluMu protein Com
MKKVIISAIIMAFVLVSCNQKDKQVETTNTPMMENDTTMTMKDTTMTMKDTTMTKDSKTKLYACPMHPESQGKLNDKCPKCGMKLTVEVK